MVIILALKKLFSTVFVHVSPYNENLKTFQTLLVVYLIYNLVIGTIQNGLHNNISRFTYLTTKYQLVIIICTWKCDLSVNNLNRFVMNNIIRTNG